MTQSILERLIEEHGGNEVQHAYYPKLHKGSYGVTHRRFTGSSAKNCLTEVTISQLCMGELGQ